MKRLLKRISPLVLGPIVLLASGAILSLYFVIKDLRAANDNANWFDPVTGVDESVYMDIGGVQQFMRIKGRERSNPVLLFLHGGPGQPLRILSHELLRAPDRVFHAGGVGK